jgi:hypothetical protein
MNACASALATPTNQQDREPFVKLEPSGREPSVDLNVFDSPMMRR